MPKHALSDMPAEHKVERCYQILGRDLSDPVDFVVCWTPDGCESEKERSRASGGTGQAIALASRLGIPVFNLARDAALQRIGAWIEKSRKLQEATRKR